MTKEEWLLCENPAPMLQFLRGKLSNRKMRLIAVAYCRQACEFLQSLNFRNAIEASEQFADGLLSDDKFRKVRSQIREAASRNLMHVMAYPWSKYRQSISARGKVVSLCSRNIDEVLATLSDVCVVATNSASYEKKSQEARLFQAQLIRDVVQHPTHPITAEPAWLTEAVVGLANGIYFDRAFERIPILADALQDAGCTHADILNHCREPGQHVRGCWVVDLILGKE